MADANIIKYKVDTGEITLSKEIVRKYLVSGNGSVTDQEVMMYLALCKHQRLNPFLREVYLIKYGTADACMVTGKEAFLKRAQKNPNYIGHETGISDDGKKAWSKVYVKGYQVPIMCEVDYDEYVGKKKDGSITKMWKEKGRTMLKKVALVQALREAFTTDFQGMYSQEEINTVDAQALPEAPVETEEAHTANNASDLLTDPEIPDKTDKAVEKETTKPEETKKPGLLRTVELVNKIQEAKGLEHVERIAVKYRPDFDALEAEGQAQVREAKKSKIADIKAANKAKGE